MPEAGEDLVVVPRDNPVFEKFDLKRTAEFSERSISEETRRAYRRVVREFFHHFKYRHPADITSKDILAWRDVLRVAKKRPATIVFKLSVTRSLYDFLKSEGLVEKNPVNTKQVPPPVVSDDLRGRALSPEEARRVLAAPDRTKTEGSRDYALMLLMLRTSIRVAEACSLKISDKRWNHGRWVLRVKVKGRGERTIPLPNDVREAIDDYLKMDRNRRQLMHSDGPESYIFQPISNYRTLEFDKPLSTAMASGTQVGKILRSRKSLAARSAAHSDHAGIGSGTELQTGSDDERSPRSEDCHALRLSSREYGAECHQLSIL